MHTQQPEKYESEEDNNIYSLSIDGELQRQTFNPFRALNPSLSPDRKHFAYNSVLPTEEIHHFA
jgi:hypothetical protein